MLLVAQIAAVHGRCFRRNASSIHHYPANYSLIFPRPPLVSRRRTPAISVSHSSVTTTMTRGSKRSRSPKEQSDGDRSKSGREGLRDDSSTGGRHKKSARTQETPDAVTAASDSRQASHEGTCLLSSAASSFTHQG